MISFNNVHFSYKENLIFKNLNLEIKKNDFIWLEGSNGIGKTTFIRLMLDFLRPQSGSITRQNKIKLGWAPAVDNSFFLRLTGKENLNFFANLSGNPTQLPAYFDQELLGNILATPFYQMSSGMKQLLIIIRSLLTDPDIILLDEPMRGLDQAHRSELQKLLVALNEQKKTIIITSHLPLEFTFSNFKRLKIYDHQIH